MHKKSLLLLLTQPKCSAWVDTLRLHSAFVHTEDSAYVNSHDDSACVYTSSTVHV